MNCPACYFDNPTGMSFCGKCAAPLARACVACGFESPPDFAFCGKCGAPLGVSGVGSRVSGKTQPRVDTRPPTPDPLSYTPKHLADKILQSKSALEGEGREEVARLHALRGEPEEAVKQQRTALALYEKLGASGHAERLAREMGC